MVSFQCDVCADTVKKPKLDQHRSKCHGTFTCLDCSTTFRNQEYRSHTSCISEAEKYEKSLYKGKKHGPSAPTLHPQPAAAVPDLASTSQPASPASSGIHPSRLQQLEDASSGPSYSRQNGYDATGGRGNRGGRGGYAGAGMRGGKFSQQGAQRNGSGGPNRSQSTGENLRIAQGGMRSWGTPNSSVPGTPAQEELPQVSMTVSEAALPAQNGEAADGEKQKKKKRKGDKGGTGSKANTKRPKGAGLAAEPSIASSTAAPATHSITPTPAVTTTASSTGSATSKRKRDSAAGGGDTASATGTQSPALDVKAAKRLRKNMEKLAEKEAALPLSTWLSKAAKGKSETLGEAELLKGLTVKRDGDKWVLSL